MTVSYTLIMTTILFLFVFLYTIRIKDFMNPVFIFLSVLTLQYWVYYIYFSDTNLVSNKTNSVYLLGIISFIIGYLFFSVVFGRTKTTEIIHNKNNQIFLKFEKSKHILLLLGILGIILGLFISIRNGTTGPSTFFFNLRYANTQLGASFGIAPYLLLVFHIYVLYTVAFRKDLKINKKELYTIIVILISTSFYQMARSTMLSYIISTVSVYMMTNKYIFKRRVRAKTILFPIVIFLLLSTIFADLTNKNLGEVSFIIRYIGYPIVSFDKWILSFPNSTDGIVISSIVTLLNSIGITSFNTNLPFTLPNGEFNVFTFLSAPYLDGGVLGVFLVLLLLGIFYSFIYYKAKKGNVNWIIVYSIFLYPLIIAFYEHQFNLTTFYYYILIIVVINILGKSRYKFTLKSKSSLESISNTSKK